MRATTRIQSPTGEVYPLSHGDIVGRLPTAALHLDDGRVSEAHAMISLREQSLKLIALRGRFAVDDVAVKEVVLEAGLDIEVARGLFLHVIDVVLPDEVLGIEGDGLIRQALPPVASILFEGGLRLSSKWVEGAPVHIWSSGSAWRLAEGGGDPRLVQPGDVLRVGGRVVNFVAMPLQETQQTPTRLVDGICAPLHIIAAYDTVHIRSDGSEALALGGIQARVVSELVSVEGPISWKALAAALWRDHDDPFVLRPRLDVTLARIRRRLRSARIRSNLIRADGAGSIELFLHPEDRVEDRT